MTLALSRRADSFPDRIGVVDDDTDESVSYAELDERADATARRLAGMGVEPDDSVAVLARNRVEHLALLFACRRLGATLAPISHRLDEDAVSTLGDRVDPAVVVHEDRYAPLAAAVDGDESSTVAELEERDEEGYDRTAPDRDAASSDPLLYLHTGGTTGVPKVVPISHRQVEWNCVTEVAAWGLGKSDVSPVFLPLYHTGGWHLLTLPTLYVGGRVVLHREFDPDRALASIERHGATHVFAVAAIFGAMADAERFATTDFSTVDWFMSGGGPTPEAVVDAYRERGQRFTQGYGLTEGGPNNCYLDPDRPDAAEKAAESVGKPFPDCELRIVDADGDPVETGDAGELEVGGPVTADGYLATEDGTFDGEWVSTGDLARRDDDGDLYIVGRTDNMFVTGGENVYPETIERELEAHPAVSAAGVIDVPHERWGVTAKAIVVPDPESSPEPTVDDLESWLADRLPDYARPSSYVFAEELPRSGPGKLDRSALSRQYGDAEDAVAADETTAEEGTPATDERATDDGGESA